MRPFELILLVVNLPLFAWCFFKRRQPAWAVLVSVSALAVLALHLAIEGYRWQFASAYLATVLLFLSCFWLTVSKRGPWLGAFGFVCLLGAAALGTIMPVFSFPTPTGPYVIGSTARHLVDNSRLETQGNRVGQKRELMIKIWYPADLTGTREIYRAGQPMTLLNHHLRLVKLHSSIGIAPAKSPPRFPVVIFSPGWTGTCSQYVFLAENLASHGFIVVGIDHPYGSHQTIFPDGRIIEGVLDRFLDFSSDGALDESLRAVEAQLAIRTADVRFTRDELERFDRDDPDGILTGRIDFSRIAVGGHSFGGAVAADTCLIDARFKAAINLDGWIFGAPMTRAIGKPLLFVNAPSPTAIPTPADVHSIADRDRRFWTFNFQNAESIRHSLAESGGHWLNLRGASHSNFQDRVLYTPLRSRTEAGIIPPLRAMEITNAYILLFLQCHLNEKQECLFDAASPRYPEIEFERPPNNGP